MKPRVRIAAAALCVLGLSFATSAQMGMRMQGPPAPQGVFNPVVGSGAQYQVQGREGKRKMEISIVGTEQFEGATGYWMETMMDGDNGSFIAKNLMVVTGPEVGIKRMIVQPPDQDPVEFDPAMMRMRPGAQAQQSRAADFRKTAEKVGTESVTVPAGTFECEHWRSADGGDVWIDTKVAPYGMVKMVNKETTMLLTKVITNAKSRITGTPRKFDPSMMMQRPPE